jgi:hypothetical protein
MNEELSRLRQNYAPSLLAYLAREDEAGLRSAYELGREAMHNSVGLLELVRIHSEIYLDVMHTAKDVETALGIARAASAFLMELLAAFEMTQRGFMDVGLRRGPSARADSTAPLPRSDPR